jgi:hypothetical protein
MTGRASTGLTLLLLLAGSGCDSTSASREFLSVVNQTRSTLVVFASADADVLDPVPQLEPGSFASHRILPGRSRLFDTVPGYDPGDEITLFVYVVQQDESAVLTALRPVPAEFLLMERRVTLRDIPSPKSP